MVYNLIEKEVFLMKIKKILVNAYKSIGFSIGRYPLTVLFLLGVAGLNSWMIERPGADYVRLVFTFLVGAVLGVVGQMLFERFFTDKKERLMTMGGTILLTLGYYLTAGLESDYNTPIIVKTSVALFALFIAFIWVPTIKNERVPFHRSFLSAFKAFFTSLVFSFVLGVGISAIIAAINLLLFNIESDIYSHVLNIIGVLFGPIYFLSLTPYFQTVDRDMANRASEIDSIEISEYQFTVPRFLEILISYIVIPLTAIYTVILALYFLINIRDNFWTDNLLEPLLVSYAIVVIVVYILSCNLENKFSRNFRKVFPKLLVPIVLFQTIASILKILEMGITHGRYYVILFGIFATIAGIVFSFMKPRNNGIIAIVLLILATISIVPPIDAFTVSKNNQINLLEEKLEKNNMLEGNEIIPNENTSEEDKIIITKIANYVESTGYTDDVSFYPANFNVYNDFQNTFGFAMTYPEQDNIDPQDRIESFYLIEDTDYAFSVAAHDVMIRQIVYEYDDEEEPTDAPIDFQVNDEDYQLARIKEENKYKWEIKNKSEEVLFAFDSKQIFDEIKENTSNDDAQTHSVEITIEDATIRFENDNIGITIIVNSLDHSSDFTSGDL